MNLNKIKLDNDATYKLKTLKIRTGLTPNILCRIGLCLSLNEPGLPDQNLYEEDGMEFNRYTLTGQWDSFFLALFKERCIQDGLNINEDLSNQFIAHLNRGVSIIHSRVKNLTDLANLF